jgi:predicted nucleic acid-binding protein
MANSIFLDTNGWLALLNSTEALHAEADRVWHEIIRGKQRIVLTDWIVAEAGNSLARFRQKDRLQIALDRILRTPRGELVFVDQELLQRAFDFFAQHSDKSWGLVDCASFVVMRDRGITDVFTSDIHFEQAGFTRLLSA